MMKSHALSQVQNKSFEFCIIKLFSIIIYYCVRDTKSTDNVVPYKISYFSLYYSCKRFGFCPFCKGINCYNGEFCLSFPRTERFNQIYSLLCKQPRAQNRGQVFWRLLKNVRITLAFVTLLHKFLRVLTNLWPIISLSNYLSH